MNATAYVRVSSKGQDFPMQKHAIERAAQARGDRVREIGRASCRERV